VASQGRILITGADGYLGSRFVRLLLESGVPASDIVGWVRADSDDELLAKRAKLAESLQGLKHESLKVERGNLLQDAPFAGVDPSTIEFILHTAAVIRFNVEENLAHDVNYQGTVKVTQFARKCARLKQLNYVGTVYASGLASGSIPETALDPKAGFGNFYESSKWHSENYLLTECSDLPVVISRVATAICDNETGRVTQYNVFHNTLKLLYYGLISILPGDREAPLYFVTGDFVAEALFRIYEQGASPASKFFHVCPSREESLTLGELIDSVFEVFKTDAPWVGRRILKPLFTDQESFDLLAGELSSLSGGIVNQAIASIEPFSKQLFLHKSFENGHTRALFRPYQPIDSKALITRAAGQLIATKWGRK
jgi:nucleoside-diphosphate-sugar epimerase